MVCETITTPPFLDFLFCDVRWIHKTPDNFKPIDALDKRLVVGSPQSGDTPPNQHMLEMLADLELAYGLVLVDAADIYISD